MLLPLSAASSGEETRRCVPPSSRTDSPLLISFSLPYTASTPAEYRYPALETLKDFDVKALEATKPMPYRPFRWGPTYPQHSSSLFFLFSYFPGFS
jgi:hypothetical protein